MPDEPPAERLRAIARRIRLLPEHPAYKGRLPGKLCRRASVLFDEALKLGAFSGPEHEVMREAVEGTQSLHPKGWQKEVWLVAVLYLCPELREQLGPVGSIEPACGPIAELIETEAAKLRVGGAARQDERRQHDQTASATGGNPVNIEVLDARLFGLLGLLADKTAIPNAAAAVRQFVQGYTSDTFGPCSLFQPDWEEMWGQRHRFPDGTEPLETKWIGIIDGLDERQRAALAAVCVEAVLFLKDSDTPRRKQKHARELREALQDYLDLRGYDVCPGQPKVEADAKKESVIAKEQQTAVKEKKQPEAPVIEVERWADLGIGIDEDGCCLAVTPCPEFGEVFPKRKAVKLDLPGKQWPALLDLLARSAEGNTASKRELMLQFGYLKKGDVSADDLEELKQDNAKMRLLNQASKTLTGAMSDLGRKLREHVKVDSPQGPALSAAEEGIVRAGFVVRHLIRGPAGKLRFGSRR